MKKLTKAENDMLARREKLPDTQIDIMDIPEAPEENWLLAQVGKRSGR